MARLEIMGELRSYIVNNIDKNNDIKILVSAFVEDKKAEL
jgi:hypothetical protein